MKPTLKNLSLSGKNMKIKKPIYLFPFSLLVIFFASFIIIFSPVGKKNLIKLTPTPTPTPNYICPKNAWIDCLPGPDKTKTECQKSYLDWAKINCQNFKGVAY